ncbi:Hypothetical protein GLP15_559 [Giardia lamblia P15]|uniref:Uncharacterized protein n=1 Tax=Giardia intestinalis (strain P15) TaxID=658858 RepID=E1F205_GIAIA|nr:Hypothetical protein GLP15_559 [Giardia lamblia P15]
MLPIHGHAPSPLTWSSLLRSLPDSVRQRVQRSRDIEELKITFFDRIDIFLEIVLRNGYLQPSELQHIAEVSGDIIARSLPSVDTLIESICKKYDLVIDHLIRQFWIQRDINDRLEARLNAKYYTYREIVQTVSAIAGISNEKGSLYYMNKQLVAIQQELINLRSSRETLINATKQSPLLQHISKFEITCADARTHLEALFKKVKALVQASLSTAAVSSTVDAEN